MPMGSRFAHPGYRNEHGPVRIGILTHVDRAFAVFTPKGQGFRGLQLIRYTMPRQVLWISFSGQ